MRPIAVRQLVPSIREGLPGDLIRYTSTNVTVIVALNVDDKTVTLHELSHNRVLNMVRYPVEPHGWIARRT